MIRHHPSGDLLASYAAGGLKAGAALVVSSHVEICADCSDEISLLNGLGGLLLAKLEPATLSQGALERALKRLGDERALERTRALQPRFLNGFAIPKRLRSQEIGARLWLAPGIWFAPVQVERGTDTCTYLVYGAKSRTLPRHTHVGRELTVVLKGAYSDDLGQFAMGDFAEADDTISHAQTVSPDGECLCLISSDGPMKPEAFSARLVQSFAGHRY
ncbi:MAG TPA: ChrR family anti-sigma-E factor [Rhizomicrobium sp.]|nr:ChrR family anti-sigma-E factor [Rhizomicrobium sp.]